MAKARNIGDWQSRTNNTLDRNRFMFNNPIMSDITFTCEDSQRIFYGHRYVLGTSSAFFYKLFYPEGPVIHAKIVVEDIDHESFEQMLRFLYTDECAVSVKNLDSLLHLAKKYSLPSLARFSLRKIDSQINGQNAFIALQTAVKFGEKDLEKRSWTVIDSETDEAIASEAFSSIPQPLLLQLLKRDTLKVNETTLCQAVIRWGATQVVGKGLNVDTENIRSVLENAIYQIRFACMSSDEFAENSRILTAEEKAVFFRLFSGVEEPLKRWNMRERCDNRQSLCLPKFPVKTARPPNIWHHIIGVSFTKPVQLHGVRLQGFLDGYDVKIELCSQIFTAKFAQSSRCMYSKPGFDFYFSSPVEVEENVRVEIKATLIGPSQYRKLSNECIRVAIHEQLSACIFELPTIPTFTTAMDRGALEEIYYTATPVSPIEVHD